MEFDVKKKLQHKIKSRIGLDIGTGLIKMVEVSGPMDKPILNGFGVKNIQGLSKEAVAESIKTLSRELKISAKECSISLSGTSLVARLLSMPKMTQDELTGAIRFEIEKFIPFDINECILDFKIQGDNKKDKDNVDVLVAAAKRETVMAKLSIVQDAGFAVNIIDVDEFALTNAFLRNFSTSEGNKTAALLNVGASSTNLVIIKSGAILFVRDVAIGTDFFTAEILRKTGVKVNLSEQFKDVPSDKADVVETSLKIAAMALIDEIKLSFGYYENQSGSGIDEVYISGGGANLAVLEKVISDTFSIKPMRWNSFSFLDIDTFGIDKTGLSGVNYLFPVAVGLALR